MWYVKEIEESKVIPILRGELLHTEKEKTMAEQLLGKTIEEFNVGFGASIRHPTGDDSWIYKNGFQ